MSVIDLYFIHKEFLNNNVKVRTCRIRDARYYISFTFTSALYLLADYLQDVLYN
jgi:hypothetical protein